MELGEFTDKLWPSVRKIFGNFRYPLKFEDYCRIVQNFISQDQAQCLQIYFQILDPSKDQQICDTDMFENMKLLETELGQEILQEDLTILARFINEQRRIQGKSDEIKMN